MQPSYLMKYRLMKKAKENRKIAMAKAMAIWRQLSNVIGVINENNGS